MACRKNIGHDHQTSGQIVCQCGGRAQDFGFVIHGGLNCLTPMDSAAPPARARRRRIAKTLIL
jgi:hypothetical protein